MRIEQLQYLTNIAKTGSIAITAERLHLSAQGISQSIKSLEEELGVLIFFRSRTGLQPTDIGEELIAKAQEVLNKLEEFKEITHDYSTGISGSLKISVVPALCRSVLPKTIAEYKKKFPKIQLEIQEIWLSSQIKKKILNNDSDLGFIHTHPSYEEENQLLQSTHLLNSSIMVCLSKNLDIAQKSMLTGEDIIKYPLAGFGRNSNIAEYHKLLKKYGKPKLLFQSDSPETKRYFISHGNAIGFDSLLSLNHDPYYLRGDYVAIPFEDLDVGISYHCIHLKNQHLSIASKEFLKELQIQVKYYKEQYVTI